MDITSLSKEAISGFTIALLMVPEAIAFSFLIGMHPAAGLKGSTVMTFITSLLGGQPGLVSGTAASTVSTIKGIREKLGQDYVFLTVVMAGILQVLVSLSGLYKYFDYVPAPVLSGFLIGLAYLIIKGQTLHLKKSVVEESFHDASPSPAPSGAPASSLSPSPSPSPAPSPTPASSASWLPRKTLVTTALFTGVELVLMLALYSANIPFVSTMAPLFTIAFMSAVIHNIPELHIETVGQRSSFKGAFPKFQLPTMDWSLKNLGTILKYGSSMMFTGLVESIVMLKQVEKIVGTKASAFKETLAQGLANGVSGMTGGIGGCVLAGQTIMNVQNKTLTRFSTLCTSLTLALVGLSFTGILNYIPIPSIIAVMIYIGWKTAMAGDITSLYRKIDVSWVVTMITIGITLFTENLSIATILGTILYYVLPKSA